MSSLAIALVLLSAALHVTWNYATKRVHATFTFLVSWMGVTALAMLPAALWLGKDLLADLPPLAWLAIAVSAPVHIVYALVLQAGYRRSDFSVVYPVARGTGPMLTVVAAIALFGDRPGLLGGLGIAALLLGIALVALPEKLACGRDRVLAGIFWGAACGCCISVYSVVDAWAVQRLAILPLFYYALSASLRAVALAAVALPQRRFREEFGPLWREHWPAVLLVAAASPGAYLTILHTLTFTPLSYVAPCREIAMMLGVFVGALLLREPVSRTRAAGILAMGGGIALLALAE